jgi:hypothetical protein
MYKKIYIIIIIFSIFISCNFNREEWNLCKKENTFESYFNFAFDNQNSNYYDSSITILTDSLNFILTSNYKLNYLNNFCIFYNEDSLRFIRLSLDKVGFSSKDNYLILDINSGGCQIYDPFMYSSKYDDLLFLIFNKSNDFFSEALIARLKVSILGRKTLTDNDTIKNELDTFIRNGSHHFIYLYLNNSETKDIWSQLFNKIKEVFILYQKIRNEYSIQHFGNFFDNLDSVKMNSVKEKIPINLAIFYSEPIPLPFPYNE